MISDYSKTIYFSLGYSGLGSLIFLLLNLVFGLDVTVYPYQKPFMIVVAAIAIIAFAVLLIFDIRRKCDFGLGTRLIIVLACTILTFRSFMQIWGFLVLYIGGF